MIYLDNAATTQPLSKVVEFAEKYIDEFYNPSAMYSPAIEVSCFLKQARQYISSCVCPIGYDCIFTSCGTEADNTAVFSAARRGNAVTTLGEHSAVYEAFKRLSETGIEVRYAALNPDGSVNMDDLLSKIDNKTSLVSVVHVNNETGAINDINALSAKIKKINNKIYFHSDGVQAFGKLPYKASDTVDMYSVSAHKIGALKGTGALLKKHTISLKPLLYGGGQECGLRSGTENVFGIAAFYKAAEIKYSNLKTSYSRVADLKNCFLSSLKNDKIRVVSTDNCLPYIISISVPRLKGEVLQHILERRGIIVGTGSACSSKNHYSRILKECGCSYSELEGMLRISFSSDTDKEDVAYAAKALREAIEELYKVMN